MFYLVGENLKICDRDDHRMKGSLSGLDGDDSPEEAEAEKTVKESILEGKLNATEFLERILELLASRLSIEKNEKEFLSFLSNYVKIVEKKLIQQDFRKYTRGSLISFEDDDDRLLESKFIFRNFMFIRF